jgi:hypothetical protein
VRIVPPSDTTASASENASHGTRKKNRIEAAKISNKKSSQESARKRKALFIPSENQAVPPRKNKDEKRKPRIVSEDRLRARPRECAPFFKNKKV